MYYIALESDCFKDIACAGAASFSLLEHHRLQYRQKMRLRLRTLSSGLYENSKLYTYFSALAPAPAKKRILLLAAPVPTTAFITIRKF
jgi:hypothetical protein